MGRLQANQIPPRDARIKSGSAKLIRKGKVEKNNYTLVRNKWGVIGLDKHNKPSAKIKSKIRGNSCNSRDNPNEGNLEDEREKLLGRGASDDLRDFSRSEPAKGEGVPSTSD